MEKKIKSWRKWIYWFTFAVATIFVYKTVDNLGEITNWFKNLLSILTPFAAGILIAYILYVPCKKFEMLYKKANKVKFIKNKARGISILTVYIIAIVIIVILINFIIPPLVQSIGDLINNFSEYYETAINKVNELPENSFWKTQVITNIIQEIQNFDIKQVVNIGAITQYAQGALNVATSIFDIFVSLIVSIYLLGSRTKILNFFNRLTNVLVNEKAYENINKYFKKSNQIFFSFLSSQILDAIIVGILTSIAMSIIGVKYSVLLGFIIGLFNLIPYIGAIIAVVIAGIITLITGGLTQAVIMLVIVTILQQIDANIINPKIVGDSLEINPILVIFSVTVGGAYFGIIGMFLAVPVIAILKLLVEDFIEYREKLIKN